MGMDRLIVEFMLTTVMDRTIWFYGMVYGELSQAYL